MGSYKYFYDLNDGVIRKKKKDKNLNRLVNIILLYMIY